MLGSVVQHVRVVQPPFGQAPTPPALKWLPVLGFELGLTFGLQHKPRRRLTLYSIRAGSLMDASGCSDPVGFWGSFAGLPAFPVGSSSPSLFPLGGAFSLSVGMPTENSPLTSVPGVLPLPLRSLALGGGSLPPQRFAAAAVPFSGALYPFSIEMRILLFFSFSTL